MSVSLADIQKRILGNSGAYLCALLAFSLCVRVFCFVFIAFCFCLFLSGFCFCPYDSLGVFLS
jgi:hypothetical protein